MKLSEICIRRPVFAWVMTLVLIAVGFVSFSLLKIQQFPKVESPYITIETSLPGAGPEIVENQITRNIEDALSGIEGVEAMSSISNSEESKVMLEFSPDRRMEDATNDIRDRLSKYRDKLPREATEPILVKSKSEDRPIITLVLTSDTIPVGELFDYAEREIKKSIDSLSGIARIDVLGAGNYEMKLYINPFKLAMYNITVAEVLSAVNKQNFEKPAGKLISADREYSVSTLARLERPEEFDRVIVKSSANNIVRFKDVGHAEITSNEKKTRSRINGKQGITIGIVKQSTANPLEVAKSVKKELKKIQENLPEGMKIEIGSDRSEYIEKSINKVFSAILEATALVILVVLLFLRTLRASLIPLVTIPVSLIGTLFILYVCGFSINMFTLLAMVLAVGLVVDDAIVVLENVYRYLEKGYKPLQAAVLGIREISFAVIAMTLTLAAVYAPVSFSGGFAGKYMTEFSIALAGSVILSGFVALTLSPMMCSRMLKAQAAGTAHHGSGRLAEFLNKIMSEEFLTNLEVRYEGLLKTSLNIRAKVAISAVSFALLGVVLYKTLPSELWPKEDNGFISFNGTSPQTASLDFTDKYLQQIDEIIAEIPDVERRVTQITNPTFEGSIKLKDDRKRATDQVSKELRKKINDKVTGVEVTRLDSASSGGGDSGFVEFVVRGPRTVKELQNLTIMVTQKLYASGKVGAISSSIVKPGTDFNLHILREQAASKRIDPFTIADIVDATIRGRKAGEFKKKDKMYDVKAEVENIFKESPSDILNLFVKGGERGETLIKLSDLVTIEQREQPSVIHHFQGSKSVSVTASLRSGTSVGDAVEIISQISKDVLPQDVRLDFVGDTKKFLNESQNIQLIFLLSLIFIYLIMAAQFESWRDPFIIMLSVPLSLAGAVLTLSLISDGSINLYSQIGLITLIGLITKHGILMVDFANKLRDERNMSVHDAIVEACKLRLRPILMTTFAMVLGAVPLALSTGAASELFRQVGWVIVGGMVIGTMFTLFVVPTFYTFISPKHRKPLVDTNF